MMQKTPRRGSKTAPSDNEKRGSYDGRHWGERGEVCRQRNIVSEDTSMVSTHDGGGDTGVSAAGSADTHDDGQWAVIYDAVVTVGRYNYCGARVPVPSGLCVEAWRRYLDDYLDVGIIDFLEFGWPVNFDRSSPLRSMLVNHASALQHPRDVDFYITMELGHEALIGPFDGPPFLPTHASPLMTRPKKGSSHRRIIMDLSWPPENP